MPPAGYPAFLQYLQSGRVSHFLESKGRNHRHHRHPRAENPEKQGIQGVTMGVTMAEHRHPAAESGSG